ncbi:hypothetical protein JL721_1794 [Aureococcus anophagefferens]|nr:hypothetical protein JL721_1794 [Aureococcus anophagefferens]
MLSLGPIDAVRLHALDVRLTLKGGLTSTGRAEVARAFGGTSQVDAAAAAVGQLDATALGVDALLIDDASRNARSRAPRAEQNAKKGRKGGSEAVAREVYRGASELGAGIFDGLTGVVVEPYRAASSGGDAAAIARATARGLLGVAVKPAVGLLDLANRGVEGVRVAGKVVHDTFQEAVATDGATAAAAQRGAPRGGLRGGAGGWVRRALDLEPHSPWARLSPAAFGAPGRRDAARRGRGVRAAVPEGGAAAAPTGRRRPRGAAPPLPRQRRRRRRRRVGDRVDRGPAAAAVARSGAARSDRRVCGARAADDEGDVLVAYVEDAVAGLERRCDAVWERADDVVGVADGGGGDDVRVLVRDGPADGDGGRRLAIGDAAVALEARLAQRSRGRFGAAARARVPPRQRRARGDGRALARQPAARVRRAARRPAGAPGRGPALRRAPRRALRLRRPAARRAPRARRRARAPTRRSSPTTRGAARRSACPRRSGPTSSSAPRARPAGARRRVRRRPRADYAGERWLRDDGDLDALVLLFPTEGAARA